MPTRKVSLAPIPVERIASQIYLVRGEKVMADSDLAVLYGIETRVLVQAVKRNLNRFPGDFMFQLPAEDLDDWRSHFVISNPTAKMGLRRPPYLFTEQGVAMLSSVLRSKRAAEVNVAIMRAFVKLRQILASDQALARKLAEHDQQIAALIDAVQHYLAPPPIKKGKIGFL